MGDKTFPILNGPYLFGASLIDGRSIRKLRPSSHTRSPVLYLCSGSFPFVHFFCALIMSLCASSLAFFQSLSRRDTVGIEDVTSKISARGLYPIRTSNGDFPVVSFFQELCANSARGKEWCQFVCWWSTQKRKYCSSHWLDLS